MNKQDPKPDYVDSDEQPDAIPENIPQDVLEKAVSIATQYRACPECGEEQFHPVVPGHNTTWDCRECGVTMRIVG